MTDKRSSRPTRGRAHNQLGRPEILEVPSETLPPAPAEEAVGYRRPPRHCRFKPGQSGNPRGRPKGSKGIDAIVSDLLGKRVQITEGGRRRPITMIEAVIRRVLELALKGDLKATRVLFDLQQQYAAADAAGVPTPADDRALIESYFARRAVPEPKEDEA